MGPLIQIAAAVVALGLTALLVLVDVRPPRKPASGSKARARRRRRRRRAPSPRIKPPRRNRARARGRAARTAARAAAAARDAEILDLPAAIRAAPATDDDDVASTEAPGVAVESYGATALEIAPVGTPVLHPDPDRLIQHEIVERHGRVHRLGALLRLVTWVSLAGIGLAVTVLAVIRGIAAWFQSAIG